MEWTIQLWKIQIIHQERLYDLIHLLVVFGSCYMGRAGEKEDKVTEKTQKGRRMKDRNKPNFFSQWIWQKDSQ